MLSDIEIAQNAQRSGPSRKSRRSWASTRKSWNCTAGTRPKSTSGPLPAWPASQTASWCWSPPSTPPRRARARPPPPSGLADGAAPDWQKRGDRPAGALPGPGVRHQGRRRRRRLCPGGPHGGHQPPLHRRLPRHRRGQQPAGAPCWTTTFSRATPWTSTPGGSPGSAAWT